MISSPPKFTFDLDFGQRQERNSIVTESAMTALLSKARAEGFEQGLAEGEQSVTARAARVIASAAESLADRAAAMSAALDDARREMLTEAVDLAASIGRKLAGHLLAREPAAEIEALIADCLASLDGVPHLVIRCHPDLAEQLREIAGNRIATSGFTGRLVVIGDPEQGLGDGQIEWADGGLIRDVESVSNEINARIAAFLAARGVTQSEETSP